MPAALAVRSDQISYQVFSFQFSGVEARMVVFDSLQSIQLNQ